MTVELTVEELKEILRSIPDDEEFVIEVVIAEDDDDEV